MDEDRRPIRDFDLLRAPQRSEERRRAAQDRILAAAEPLLARRWSPSNSWEVLAAWARPGLVAASVAFLLLAGAVQLRLATDQPAAPTPPEEMLAAAERGQLPTLLVAASEPDADAIVAAALLERNGRARPDENSNRIER